MGTYISRVMALYFFDGSGVQAKPIEYGCNVDLVSASTQAFLGYAPMQQVAMTAKACHSYLYIALTGFRQHELSIKLCGVCGWLTGRRHTYLSCGQPGQTQAYMYNAKDEEYYCGHCVRDQQGIHVAADDTKTCLYCLGREALPSIRPLERSVIKACHFSKALNNAIRRRGVWRRQASDDDVVLVYPYSVSLVLGYDVNYRRTT